ncbi:hypothetical protein BK143_09635 [Paenibacillus peoriae]|uniref:hypothetical protein n=1 Tax=Paenibacillus peoriae TaxID=59893 RepID=UPI00096E059C|nr:hypothetical protein [Paenibacillus peoriae]OMF72518.1 hypothetical protein BK143_09635 [Paenibacillus peoriae]
MTTPNIEQLNNRLPDLKHVSTNDLINELATRPGIEKISVGSYQHFELKRKYHKEYLSDEDIYVEAKEVLVVLPNLKTEDSLGTVERFWQERSDLIERSQRQS